MTHSPEQLGDLIVAIYKELKAKTEKSLKSYGIGMGQLQILMLLYAHPDSSFSQNELVKLLNIDKGNISRNIKKLIDKRYLEQVPEHSKMYQLSAQGKMIKGEIMTTFMALHQTMTEGLSIDELTQTVLMLSKISLNLEAL
jgi:DNA-binding MarR family transcriptional regulator